MTIEIFKPLPINQKLEWTKKIANLTTLNSVNKSTFQYILKWFVDYSLTTTDMFDGLE